MQGEIFPHLNAALNATAGVLLFLGWRAIKSKNKSRHQTFMICALMTSGAFLVSYGIYHLTVRGVTHYTGEGIRRWIYFFILLTHTPLAALIVPLSLLAIWHAFRGDFIRHTRITRWLFPIWMYV